MDKGSKGCFPLPPLLLLLCRSVSDGRRRRGAALPYGLNTLCAIRVLKLSQSRYAALVKIKIVCVELLTNTITITHQVGRCSWRWKPCWHQSLPVSHRFYCLDFGAIPNTDTADTLEQRCASWEDKWHIYPGGCQCESLIHHAVPCPQRNLSRSIFW